MPLKEAFIHENLKMKLATEASRVAGNCCLDLKVAEASFIKRARVYVKFNIYEYLTLKAFFSVPHKEYDVYKIKYT